MTEPSPHTDFIFDAMTAQSQVVPLPPQKRRFVSGFPAHSEDVMKLPLSEHMLLRVLVDWVISTHEMPHAPVAKISFIGHADRDPNVTREFEVQLSRRRAEAVRVFFITEFFRTIPINLLESGMRIDMPDATGIGSEDFIPAHNEEQRLKNRRVTIVFDHGRPPPPPPPFILDLKVKVPPLMIGPMRPGAHPWTRPIPPKIPMPPSKFQERIDEIRKALEFFDKGVIAKGLFEGFRHIVDPPTTPEELREIDIKRAETFRDDQEEEDRKRRIRTLDPPGPPDPTEIPSPLTF